MLTVRSARQSGLKHTHTQPEQQQRYVSAPPPSLTPPPTRVPEPHWARGHHKSRGGASERGQGLDCESDAGDQITPLAGAAELACIANKLPPLSGGGGGGGGVVVCSVHSSPSRAAVFAVQRTLLSAKYTFVLFYIANRGQLELWRRVLMLLCHHEISSSRSPNSIKESRGKKNDLRAVEL